MHNLNQFPNRNTEAYADYYIFHPFISNAADWYEPFDEMAKILATSTSCK